MKRTPIKRRTPMRRTNRYTLSSLVYQLARLGLVRLEGSAPAVTELGRSVSKHGRRMARG